MKYYLWVQEPWISLSLYFLGGRGEGTSPLTPAGSPTGLYAKTILYDREFYSVLFMAIKKYNWNIPDLNIHIPVNVFLNRLEFLHSILKEIRVDYNEKCHIDRLNFLIFKELSKSTNPQPSSFCVWFTFTANWWTAFSGIQSTM